jgi:hypothetical protein
MYSIILTWINVLLISINCSKWLCVSKVDLRITRYLPEFHQLRCCRWRSDEAFVAHELLQTMAIHPLAIADTANSEEHSSLKPVWRRMARYYFQTEDGRCHPDPDGLELPDLQTVREEAVCALCEIVKESPATFWEDGAFRLIVSDETGLMLFMLDLSAVMSAAVRPAFPAPPQ